MNLINNIVNNSSSTKKHHMDNLHDYLIKIDYFDEKGRKIYKNKIPLKYILNKDCEKYI